MDFEQFICDLYLTYLCNTYSLSSLFELMYDMKYNVTILVVLLLCNILLNTRL